MDISYMRQQLIKWHPNWKRSTVMNWKNNQILAIYTKELEKHEKYNNKIEQLSFL